jgi:hypothetical protein
MNNNRKTFQISDQVLCVMGTRSLTEGKIYTIVSRDEITAADGKPFFTYTATDSNGNLVAVKNGHLSFKLAA